MNLSIRWFLLGLFLAAGLTSGQAGDPASPRLDLKEVRELIQSQLPGLDEAALDEATARGLIEQLGPRVQLVSSNPPSGAPSDSQTVVRTRVFDKAYGYVLLGKIGSDSPAAFLSAWQNLASSNTLKGLILDMRFAAGDDYKAAAGLADPFFTTREQLLDWGKGPDYSETKTNAINLPLAILINRRTVGAAEALAGILRHGLAALLIGSPTAGQASVYREFTLTTGHHLRIATRPVQVGPDGLSITVEGLKPDLLLTVAPERERAWLEDPFRSLAAAGTSTAAAESSEEPGNGTPSAPRRRINEAELVRMLREGDLPDWSGEISSRPPPTPNEIVQDPALARALDFLKGLAVVRQFRAK